MRFLRYIFCALLFVTASVADTININWGKDNQPYTTTTCTVGGDVVLPTPPTKRGYTFKGWAPEYFNRGHFLNWSYVSTDASDYRQDIYGNHKPMNGDYMVVQDAGAYVVYNKKEIIECKYTGGGIYENFNTRIVDSVTGEVIAEIQAQKTISAFADKGKINTNGWGVAVTPVNETMRINGNEVAIGTKVILLDSVRALGIVDWTQIGIIEYSDQPTAMLSGPWKFVYRGNWDIDGKDGWKPLEQIVTE